MYQLQKIENLPSTKASINAFVEDVANMLQNEGCNLNIAFKLKALEDLAIKLRKNKTIKNVLINEAGKYTKEELKSMGIELCEVGTKYDFTACNDIAWNELKQQEDWIVSARKKREELLKTISINYLSVEKETGEVVKPPLKTSETGLKITLKK